MQDAGKKHFLTKGTQKTSNVFEKSVPKLFEIETWSLQNRAQSPPKSKPGASKIEPGAFQDDIFSHVEFRIAKKARRVLRKLRFEANLVPSWRPKTLQNRSRNPKKSMLKNNTFLASILKGFGPHFGRVFGKFF